MCLLVVPLRLQERKLHINGLQNEWNPRVTSVSWQPLAVRGEKLSRNEAAALIAAPGNDRKAAERALSQAEKGNIQISNQTRKALEQATSGKKKNN
jgi:uncharacterized membrane protein